MSKDVAAASKVLAVGAHLGHQQGPGGVLTRRHMKNLSAGLTDDMLKSLR